MVVINQEDKTPELLVELLNISRVDAEFILAIERGEIPGDVIARPEGSPDEE